MRKRLIAATGLTLVVLVALSAVESVAQDRSDSKKDPPKAPVQTTIVSDGSMNLKLKKGLDLKGTPLNLESVKMTSIIGEIDIPLHTIAGIKFPEKSGDQHTLVLHNGDSLTGDVQLSSVKIVSQWGEALVNTSELTYVVFGDDLRWSNDAGTGKGRWRLSRPPATPAVQRPVTAAARSSTRPTRVYRNGY